MEDNGTGVVARNRDAAGGGTGDVEVACSGCSRSVAVAGGLGSLDGSVAVAVGDVAADLLVLSPDEDPSGGPWTLSRVHSRQSSSTVAVDIR